MRLIPPLNRFGLHLAWACVVLAAFLAGRVSTPINRYIPSDATGTRESATSTRQEPLLSSGLTFSELDQFGVIASATKGEQSSPILFDVGTTSSVASSDGRQIFTFTMGLTR